MAYSKNFFEVFQSIGLQDCVVDMQKLNKDKIVERIVQIFWNKNKFRDHLHKNIPQIEQTVSNLFEEVRDCL